MSTAIVTGQPVPGSSLESDLRSLGFDVRAATDASEAEALLAAVPADRRVALVDARFVGHPHALRLGLTDPRFPLAAVPGAVTAQPTARQALTRALARETSAGGGTAVGGGGRAPRGVTARDADGPPGPRTERGSRGAPLPDDP
ncbi:CDP-alcohol phosphatidyltransferase family protein, partial [Streptomyces diastatochromogenes]